ncbi:MAG: ABC transporter ATP-binding protein [Anaerolineales bacterium]|nr:ABC transporter ATP-binding protein [Anaerolineales bacterium]
MTDALTLTQLSKVYGSGQTRVQALCNINLSVMRGELVAIMGPSGSGKSTLLAIAGTLEQPSEGGVSIGGVDALALSSDQRAHLRSQSVGYVFQEFNLLAGLTALENVTLPLELSGKAMRDARQYASIALERLGIAARATHYPDELSGGERQRVAIARAIVGERQLILADEPTGALDSVTGESVMRLLREACHDGIAAVVVTHDAKLAAWADRILFLRDGCFVDQAAAEASYLVSPRIVER